jgi:hypothetical protein
MNLYKRVRCPRSDILASENNVDLNKRLTSATSGNAQAPRTQPQNNTKGQRVDLIHEGNDVESAATRGRRARQVVASGWPDGKT